MKIANYHVVPKNVLNSALLSSDSVTVTKEDRARIPNIVTYNLQPQQGFLK